MLFLYRFTLFFSLFSLFPLWSQEDGKDIQNKNKEMVMECSREALLSFFPKPIVYKVLQQYGIPEAEWASIYRDLEQKDRAVIPLVEEKASKMEPNPLKDLRYRSEAVRLFRETLVESFTKVMNEHGITDEEQIEEMLDDIQIEKARAFADCIENLR